MDSLFLKHIPSLILRTDNLTKIFFLALLSHEKQSISSLFLRFCDAEWEGQKFFTNRK